MRRGTTPTHTFVFPFDTGEISKVRIIYSQDREVVLTKEGTEVSISGDTLSTTVTTMLTQSDTLLFNESKDVEIQVRVLTSGAVAFASDIEKVFVGRCLEDEVLE